MPKVLEEKAVRMLENIGLAKTFSEIFLQGDRSVSKAKMLFFLFGS